jgi:hypothetical protein
MPRSHSCHFGFLYEIQQASPILGGSDAHFLQKAGDCTNRSVPRHLRTAGLAPEQKFKAVPVMTTDGLTISAQDWGNPDGPEILFIHGFSQGHVFCIKQVRSE